MTEIYEKGEAVSPEKVAEMLDRFRERVGSATAVSLSGSLPPGAARYLCPLINIAHEADVPAFLDSSSHALRHGVAAKPFLIKPNETEVSILAEQEADHAC
ncbi:MAG: PfkB family carbohydrate kinase [Chloroflexi bacterium]|nr:PfkB family carbohydrate kinase [Chloroflexota bacterium]